MIQEQISQLAREYAKYKLPNPLTYDDDLIFSDYRHHAKTILDWLLRDHLIVEKEKAANLWEASQLGGLQPHEDVVQADAVAHALQYLFPETFNQDEQ